MTDKAEAKVQGIENLATALRAIAPDMRRGPALRALRAGAEPVLQRAIQETPQLDKPVFRKGKMIRRPGTLRRALRIRSSKDASKNGDVGVFVNIKPLERSVITAFKNDTGRRSSENPDDPFYWRFVHFVTKKNKNPKPFLTRAGAVLQSESLGIVIDKLNAYLQRLNSKVGKP